MAKPSSPWPWVALGAAGLGAAWLLTRDGGRLPGTIFTIVFENRDRAQVIGAPGAPYFTSLARQYGDASGYVWPSHPSLPAYITMVKGDADGITDDLGHRVAGSDNLAAQLDAAGIPWRAYAEGARAPCQATDSTRYARRHVPWVYLDYVRRDAAYCRAHVVPFEPDFWQDLAADRYRYMWVTPDLCNDMHDCSVGAGDAWLARVLPRIMASPGYRRGGAVFLLFDEGAGSRHIPAVVVSPRLRAPGVADLTAFDHRSYLAAVEDLLGLPRLPTTAGVPSMASMLRV